MISSNRLIDYFVVIGSPFTALIPLANHNTHDPLRIPYTPQILDRYPLDDHDNTSFPSGLTLFCLPEGLHLTTKPKPASFFSFVQTSDTGSRLIGCCFTFYEPLNDFQRKSLNNLIDQSNELDISSSALAHVKFYVPRCLCLVSQWPFVSSFKMFLCHIYRLSLTPCYVPLERYICNFVDEIPLPSSGKMEVSYFIGDEVVYFTRPPCNEPQAWSMNLSILPLFECLSYENVLSILSAILSERQIVLVSSQYSLLTLASEALLSFIFPLKWTHVYIPILPRQLLGVLAAPLPFLVGVHSSFLAENDDHFSSRKSSFCHTKPKQIIDQDQFYSLYGCASFAPETMRVFLDTDEVEFGSLGSPPSFPESRRKRLLADLSKSAPSIEERSPNWEDSTLPYYDSAFPMAARPNSVDDLNSRPSIHFDARGVHVAFLNLFTYLFQDYRKLYLIHPTHADPAPIRKFRTTDFLQDCPSESAAILSQILQSQAFFQFIEASISISGWMDPGACLRYISSHAASFLIDILFFDESIEACLNRSSLLAFLKPDTPCLFDVSQKHTKTLVAPSPNETLDDVLDDVMNPTDPLVAATQSVTVDKTGKEIFRYSHFPKLNAKLYKVRSKSSSSLVLNEAVNYTSPLRSVSRLKRVNSYSPKYETPLPEACIYSTYLILFSQYLANEYSIPIIKHNPPSLSQILSSLHISRPLSISTEGGLSSHQEFNFQSMEAIHSEDTNLLASEQAKIKKTESFLGDIELISFNVVSISLSEGNMEEKSCLEISTPIDEWEVDPNVENSERKSKGFLHYHDNVTEEAVLIAQAAMEILFEIFEYMESKQLHINEEVYRSIAEACAVCNASDRVISILESMITHGMVPDIQISIAVARALYFSSGDISDEMADTGRSDVPLFLPVTPKEVSEAVLKKDLKRLRSSIRRKGNSYQLFPSSSIQFPLLSSSSPSRLSTGNQNHHPSPLQSLICNPQYSLANRVLDVLYPDLHIDLSHPHGIGCPNIKCQKLLTFIEVINNFSSNIHQYTVTCPYCILDFVPRFTVYSSLETWEGSEGKGTLLWCEFLSPWTLQKEILSIIESNGISSIISSSFRDPTINSQYSTIFWNLMIYCRHYGLPYAFLITQKLNFALLIT